MPHLSFSETVTRGDDPVYVFGSKLRQQRFTAADFALNKLNTPLPIGNFTTRFGGSWNLFDSFATWHGVSRAKHMNEAAKHQLDRTDQEIVFRVVTSYYDVDASRQQIDVARAAIAQAQESLRINQDRYESGLTTITDLLVAEDATLRSQTDYWEAIYHFQTSYANLELASGSLNPQSPVVMP